MDVLIILNTHFDQHAMYNYDTNNLHSVVYIYINMCAHFYHHNYVCSFLPWVSKESQCSLLYLNGSLNITTYISNSAESSHALPCLSTLLPSC